jgi:hypothetical protein
MDIRVNETMKDLNKDLNKKIVYEVKESESSDYESKSYISERIVYKAKGTMNEVYNDTAILK